jgi:hypothetical protein
MINGFFFIFLIVSERQTDFLRKLIRVFQSVNDVRFISISRKLNISEEEGQKIGDEIENKLTDEEKKSLYADMDDLGL